MEFNAQMRDVLEHTINGTLSDNFCLVCLDPLDGPYENSFTRICKENFEFSVADVLNEVCNIQVTESNSSVCYNCFTEASISYKFYLQSKRTEEILNHYVTELNDHVSEIELNTSINEPICIFLTSYTPKIMKFDFNINNISQIEEHYQKIHKQNNIESDYKKNLNVENIIILVNELGKGEFYKIEQSGSFVRLENDEYEQYKDAFDYTKNQVTKKKRKIDDKDYIPRRQYKKIKKRRPRLPMAYKVCSQCPIKYRFSTKLKKHMKFAHNIDLFICQVCKALIEDEREFDRHIRTHTNIYVCSICSIVFKKRRTIIAHIQKHEDLDRMATRDDSHVCELCGHILPDLGSLHEHYDKTHDKKYMCFYCGKGYKGELSFETHVRKHELLSSNETVSLEAKQNEDSVKEDSNNKIDDINEKSENTKIKQNSDLTKPDYKCETCSRTFVDARALMWHQRLHNNEKPYVCEECGRAFVTLNRRNQHSMCAHTAPTRRCPLCPALFHLRSMVNSHIRKVHLNSHKRRNRVAKHQNVFWKTETVPIQDLSVTVQHKLLDMQTNSIDAFDPI